MLFTLDKFSGEDDEDVEEFLDAVMLSFTPQEALFTDMERKEKARLLFLASMFEGKGQTNGGNTVIK